MAKKIVATSTAAPSGVPQYVFDHAPLVHLHDTDPYRPSSISAQITNTHPEVDFKPVTLTSSPLALDNLDQLNAAGDNVYLTSNEDITTNPKWLEGILPDANGSTGDEKTSVIVLVEKDGGILDAFYFNFYAFNWGGVVLEKQLGDHVGDWEHSMIRFVNGVPKYIWLSQHANGEAFTFAAMKKDASGKRPLCFSATGSHALYPTAGTHDHTIPNLNLPTPFLLVDYTTAGPIYDPVLSSHVYTYTPSTRTFTPSDPSAPTSFLTFSGKWGDAEYPESDPRQKGKGLFSFKKYVGGPTGPADKQLDRKDVWPDNQWSKGQRIRTSIDGSTWLKDTFDCSGLMARMKARKERKKGVKRIDVSGKEVGR